MFSKEERVIFQKNQLVDVICQLRFPEILSVAAKAPADFQDAIRGDYPQYNLTREIQQPKVVGAPGSFRLEEQPETVNHQFQNAEGTWKINLTSRFISLSCGKYTRWEDFAGRLDKVLSAFIRVYSPAYFNRVGLRFVNAISREALDLAEVPFRSLIQPCYLGPLAEPDASERAFSRCSVDLELALPGGCRARVHAGPGVLRRPGQKPQGTWFILDEDLFTAGNIPVNLSAGVLNCLHEQADEIFRGALTDTLYEAMEPREA